MSGDTLTPQERSERMGRVRNKDTKPELVVRRLIHSMGFRYRLHSRTLPGNPDIVFRSKSKAIFVHGCFWHRHDDSRCSLARWPKSKLDFWVPKLEGNAARDIANQQKLHSLGWKVLVIWECQLRNRETLALRIRQFMETA